MNIDRKKVTAGDVARGYKDTDEDGVFGLGGELNIRPPYQREFVYTPDKQEAVIRTILAELPLNTMYWALNDDGTYEVVDGQQRILSICRFVHGHFSVDFKFYANLSAEEQKAINDYQLMVYVCEGSDKDRLDWFRTINIAAERLTDQELLNAVYAGPWLTDAKRRFSKTGGPAATLAADYVKGSPIRQDYLETALRWISGDRIEDYMARHQHQPNANGLWLYFQSVINWVQATFPHYRREMKGVDWGALHRLAKGRDLDPKQLEDQVSRLMEDEDVSKKSGIYAYLITGEERHLNIRAFTPNQKREAYERQKGICARTGEALPIEEMEADHIRPWHEGGKTNTSNCQMISKAANRTKSGK
jgi:hypothetical protein